MQITGVSLDPSSCRLESVQNYMTKAMKASGIYGGFMQTSALNSSTDWEIKNYGKYAFRAILCARRKKKITTVDPKRLTQIITKNTFEIQCFFFQTT